MHLDARESRLVAPLIAVFGAIQIATAIWMLLAPRSFFDQIGPFGAYNVHYLRDVAAFQGGIGIALIASLRLRALRPGAVCALFGATALHAINHIVDISAVPGSNADLADALLVTLSSLVAGWLLWATSRAGEGGRV